MLFVWGREIISSNQTNRARENAGFFPYLTNGCNCRMLALFYVAFGQEPFIRLLYASTHQQILRLLVGHLIYDSARVRQGFLDARLFETASIAHTHEFVLPGECRHKRRGSGQISPNKCLVVGNTSE